MSFGLAFEFNISRDPEYYVITKGVTLPEWERDQGLEMVTVAEILADGSLSSISLRPAVTIIPATTKSTATSIPATTKSTATSIPTTTATSNVRQIIINMIGLVLVVLLLIREVIILRRGFQPCSF